jgi:putative Mn2+ efflux pump MntP
MTFSTLVFLALGLSMDAFAVTISNGLCYRNVNGKMSLCSSFLFGLFQALMPLIGFFAGQTFYHLISAVDHWVAFLLLGFIGGKMLLDAIRELRHPASCPVGKLLTPKTLFLQAIATSIDALAVGISLAAVQVKILPAVLLIGLITFGCCLIGSQIGKKAGARFQQKAEIFGGLILVIIGLRILIEHLFF